MPKPERANAPNDTGTVGYYGFLVTWAVNSSQSLLWDNTIVINEGLTVDANKFKQLS